MSVDFDNPDRHCLKGRMPLKYTQIIDNLDVEPVTRERSERAAWGVMMELAMEGLAQLVEFRGRAQDIDIARPTLPPFWQKPTKRGGI